MGKKCKINGFKYPAADNISSRTSTICRSMACTLLKREPCSQDEEVEWMKYFPEKKCAYCGREATHLDHLHPLIVNRKPTGYGTEPANLVPCCDKCNQPKGNWGWEDFMRSENCKHVEIENPKDGMESRIDIIKRFQAEMPPQKAVIDDTILDQWDDILHKFDDTLKKTQDLLIEIKKKIY